MLIYRSLSNFLVATTQPETEAYARFVLPQEAQSRNAAGGGAAEAGNKAVAELSLHLVNMEADERVIDPRALAAVLLSPRLVAGQS